MKKRIFSLLLAALTLFSVLAAPVSAASTLQEAMAEVNIYAKNTSLVWLTMNGAVKEQHYTYYNYRSVQTGATEQIPAYCTDPRLYGVPALVSEGTPIKYSATETVSDPKVMGIIANGYPHMTFSDLGVNSVEEAYYATKTALWIYLLGNWSVSGLGINPALTGADKAAAQRVLQATKAIYQRGMYWSTIPTPKLTATPESSTAVPATINGKSVYAQTFTVTTGTWSLEPVLLALSESAPAGAKITDMDGDEISALNMRDAVYGSDGYSWQVKVVYPKDSIEGQTGTAKLVMSSTVVQYELYFAKTLEADRYGNIQEYVLDTDPHIPLTASAISNYSSEPDDPDDPDDPGDPGETVLKIVKRETGTETPLAGAVLEVLYPSGDVLGSFSTDEHGTVTIPVPEDKVGNFTVTELTPPANHLLSDRTTQNVTVIKGRTATLTFWNDPYGTARIEKVSDTGDPLKGVTVQIKNITTGETQTGKTGPGGAVEFQVRPGDYEVREIAGSEGWQLDAEAVKTLHVETGGIATAAFTNHELPGLKIIKYSRKDKATMPDVTFEIWRDGVSLGKFITDPMGEVLLLNATPGTYLVHEVDTGDDGKILDTTPQQVELKAGDGIKQLVFFNDTKPGIHLIKVDSSNLNTPVANARFRFEAVDGSWGPQEFTTEGDGTIDLSTLPATAFVVTELDCPGYVIDNAQRIVQLHANIDQEFVFTNSKLPQVHLVKLGYDGKPLAGVSFRLAKVSDGGYYLDRTTDANGEITWEGLDYTEGAVYSLQEIATVSDHILDPREYHIQVFPGKVSDKVLQNYRRSDLYIHKSDADDGAPVKGAVFLVKAADGHSIAEVETDANGVAVVKNLLPQVVQVIEKSVPSPYLLDAPAQLATLYPNRDRDVYFQNHKRPVVTLYKENSITHDPLENVPFRFEWASNKSATGELRDLGTYRTDADGKIELQIEDGWLKITELEPPTGFAIKDSAVQEGFVEAGKGKVFRFENTPLSAICVWKYDDVDGTPVQATFQIRYLSGNESGTGGTVIGTFKTSAQNGSFTVTGLKAGTYIIEELASDSNHVVSSAPQTVYISGKDQDCVSIYFGNVPKGNLLVRKVSTGADKAPLSDTEFLVTTSDGSVVGLANGHYKTDSAGCFLVENIAPGTTLIVKELRAKDGYLLDDTPQSAVIQPGRTVSLEFRNQPIGSLTILKRSGADKKTPLQGVQFELRYADGSFVDADGGRRSSNGIYYTDERGMIQLPVTGTIVATELASIEGYTIDENTRTQTVTVRPDDSQTLYFYNDPVGGLLLTKVNEADRSQRIPNTTFEIHKLDGALVTTVTTGENGTVFVPLTDGGYYAVETVAGSVGGKHFVVDPTPIYFEVKDGKQTVKTVTNKAFCGILIHKVDADTGRGIYGVSFLLYDGNHNPIGQYESDQNGDVLIDGLTEAGRYYLRELSAEGYIVDTQLKSINVQSGQTTEITWKNTAIRGQIQIIKKSADDNPINALPKGTLLEGAVFEIYDRAGNVVDTVKTDSRGRAVSRLLPLSRYTVREVSAPQYYAVNPTVFNAYLEYEGQIVSFEVEDESVATGVSIKKTGYTEVMPGQPIRYTITGVANTSTVPLGSFFWRDALPSQVRLDKVVTGTYNQQLAYKVVYKTNLSGDQYRTLADNLSTTKNYVLEARPAALGLAANERVTEVMFVFGTVKGGFAEVETAYLYGTVNDGLSNGASIVNVADAGGLYNGQWIMAVSRWLTTVYAKTTIKLPKTGY